MDVSESMKVGEMKIHHFSHPQHPLFFISDPSFATHEDDQVSDQSFASDDDQVSHQSFASDDDQVSDESFASDDDQVSHQRFASDDDQVSDESFASDDDQVIKTIKCFGCGESLDNGWRYECKECKYYLHKECAELVLAPQIDHPFHPQHLLTLLPKSPYKAGKYGCEFCDGYLSGFVYHCASCEHFDLHVKCCLLQSSIASNFPNSLHQHPLFFLPNHNDQLKVDCSGCVEPLSGPIYHCSVCSSSGTFFNLHKECGELSLEINHPFHSQHLLTLLPETPYSVTNKCDFCDFCANRLEGFVYHCDPCEFDLDINCALLESSIAPNFPNSLHQHPLLFLPNHNDQRKTNCSGCMKALSGPIYHCSVCTPYESDFNLHKECAELPLEINHSYDRKHPLVLLQNPPHPQKCGCHLCKIKWKGSVYSCTLCNVHLTLEDVSAPRTITNASHQHPWTLLSRQMSFTCDFCGTGGDRTPYLCAARDLLVHRYCISLPLKIMITRHHHVISHSYSLPQNNLEERICRICYLEVDTQYGSYNCSRSDCNYIVHPLCATDESIWDGVFIPDDYDESSMEELLRPSNLITVVSEQMGEGEQMVAIEIKHKYHRDHNLRLVFTEEIKDDGIQCDGCMMPISTPFYSCHQCNFDLHKHCAELSRGKRHPFHKHLLMLSNLISGYKVCSACRRHYNGFSYSCNNKDCGREDINYDIRCIQLSDALKHPSHEHSLFLVHNPPTKCNGCLRELDPLRNMAYRCTKRCDFALDLKCATIPLEAEYKYDRHPLTLTYCDKSSPSQHYCDLCENERDPKDWFYHCTDCDNSLHSKCALAKPQFLKLGNKFRTFHYHRHSLTVVKNIWNCPPCKVCSDICNGPALECKESECNFTIHWKCRWFVDRPKLYTRQILSTLDSSREKKIGQQQSNPSIHMHSATSLHPPT